MQAPPHGNSLCFGDIGVRTKAARAFPPHLDPCNLAFAAVAGRRRRLDHNWQLHNHTLLHTCGHTTQLPNKPKDMVVAISTVWP